MASMEFVGMKSITKKLPERWTNEGCTDWVATEKVHGSSYQFFTKDGHTIKAASRRYVLKDDGSFLKCGVADFKRRYETHVKAAYQMIVNEDRWEPYRQAPIKVVDDDDEEEEVIEEKVDQTETHGDDSQNEFADDVQKRLAPSADEDQEAGSDMTEVGNELTDENESEPSEVNAEDRSEVNQTNQDIDQRREKDDILELRVYGELYGGGGIEKPIKPAVQKEIIYCDEFRFYVFGMTVNRNWLSVTEMNDICRESGFPHYATPVCEPKASLEELQTWLTESGFMRTKSRLTERTDNLKVNIEGVVMCPLTRPGFGYHAVKFLAPAFNDVRNSGKQQKEQKPNYCTKARYNSVISKLDLDERADAEMVAEMFIADILKESGEGDLSNNKRKAYTKCVRIWLAKDGYIQPENADTYGGKGKKNGKAKLGDIPRHEEKVNRDEVKGQEVTSDSGSRNEHSVQDLDESGDEAMCFGLFD